ncbi:CIC11C00000002931 [Sungouiella intermedia]|uniref:CIC11C00000002931 n=1 Tax=Sungouiella intermedia TaxID=45354 RepID=A0A1L0BN84_9ASCO|nr:CIC11C00000002931 [[Candida] intermedia]
MLNEDYFAEDLPGNKRKKHTRSESVQLGYASDSEDNGQGDLDEEIDDESDELLKSDQEKEKEDISDDDMFASDNEEVNEKKKSKTLDMDKFEQEQGLGEYDEQNVAATEENQPFADPEEEQELIDYHNNIEDFNGEDISRPKQELALEAFNLREEVEEGEFDKNMNYIRKKTSDDENDEDAWMSNIKKIDIEKARAAQLRRQNKVVSTVAVSTETLIVAVLDILEPAETPMEALSRLRPCKSRRGNKLKKVSGPEDLARKQTVFNLTESCERLMNEKGVSQIYDMTKEELMRVYKRETGEDYRGNLRKRQLEEDEAGEDELEKEKAREVRGADAKWEYRWLDEESVWHGPHTSYEMKYWKDNYFENNVEVRRVGEHQVQHISEAEFPNDIDYRT